MKSSRNLNGETIYVITTLKKIAIIKRLNKSKKKKQFKQMKKPIINRIKFHNVKLKILFM